MTLRIAPVLGLLLIGAVSHATAQTCPADSSQVVDVLNLVAGKTLCAARGNDKWQEFHSGGSGGNLIDYKLGSNHAVDPTKTVGRWSALNSVLTHSYTGGSSYSWLVCRAVSSYTLVSTGSSGSIVNAAIVDGQRACP